MGTSYQGDKQDSKRNRYRSEMGMEKQPPGRLVEDKKNCYTRTIPIINHSIR